MFYIGITLEKDFFRVAIVRKEKQKLQIESTHSFPYEADHVKLFYNLPPLKTKDPIEICSGLENLDLFIRRMHLPLRKKEKILKALPFQLESLLPFSNTPPLVCVQLQPLNPQMTSITIIATVESKLKAHLDRLAPLDIHPSRVSCLPAAASRFISWYFPNEERVLSLDTKDTMIACTLVEKGEILLSQTLCLENDPMAFEKLIFFLKQKGINPEETPWVLTGNMTTESVLKNHLPGKQLHLSDPSLPPYAGAVGLALDAAAEDQFSIQFCQGSFTPVHVARKRKKQLITYIACCLGSALIVGISSLIMLHKKENLLAKELKTYYPSFQEQTTSIEDGLIAWENSLKGKKNAFALVPNVPKVSDLLAYLSSHPSLITEEGERKEGIEIESLHYSLVKYPKIGDSSSPYVAQVELDLSSPTPRAARDFHEALLKGDKMINTKKEIKWQTQNTTHHISFELNKGVLP